ncbi:MAG: hypothetical protein ACFFFH_20195, partial [Candidatus Thorarchaeota archaeon]
LRAVSDRLNRRALDEGKRDYGVAIEFIAKDIGAERQIRIENALEDKRDRESESVREIEELLRRQKQIEEELRRIASPHASERDELIQEKARLTHELDEIKEQIQEEFKPLTILLAGNSIRDALRKKIEQEQRAVTSTERLEELRNQMEEVKQRTFFPFPEPSPDILLSEKQMKFYLNKFDESIKDILGFNSQDDNVQLHDIGDAKRRLLLEKIFTLEKYGCSLKEIIDRREQIYNELREVEIRLQSTSDDPYVEKLLKENRGLTERIGALKEEQSALNADIQRLEADLSIRSRQIEDRLSQRAATSQAKRIIKLAQTARRTLDDFIKQLAPEKLLLLQKYMDEMYSRLRKPEDPIRSIEIDSETWQVILKDEKGRPLEKRVFSQGMKEMYALSLIWALAKASGRELPIVIDTPVGRLDTTNRRSLFEKYLPSAGHQVIILSTDTEVDVEWAKRLAPFVAQQYRLDYDSVSDSIIIRPGYFF